MTPETKYPDTPAGALRLLADTSDVDLSSVDVPVSDPWVRGCWRVGTKDGCTFLVYVGRHPDAPSFEAV